MSKADMSGKLAEKLYSDNVRNALSALNPTGDIRERQKEYLARKLLLCGAAVLFGLFLSAVLWIKEYSDAKIVDNRLYRNAYGDGSKQVELVAENDAETLALSLEIEEKQYDKNELDRLLAEFIPMLENAVLGDNISLDMVQYDLCLADSIEGYPFLVEWRTDGEYIDYNGQLIAENLAAPAVVELTAVISCDSYETRHTMSCYVYSKKSDGDAGHELLNQLEQTEADSRENEFMTLPSEINGSSLNWSLKKSNGSLIALAATPIVALLLYYGADKDLYKQIEDRKQELRLDYPEVVSSLALLIGAGMTPVNAWVKLIKDYTAKKQKTGKSRCVYEEMLLTAHEMQNGVSHVKAYENFGLRCQLTSYNKLAALMAQNITKGSSNLAQLLREEASAAFEERKHLARELGEKAGTKLLAPMMMLLGMIMIIIIVPAFVNYF